jgi:hypothetical protein
MSKFVYRVPRRAATPLSVAEQFRRIADRNPDLRRLERKLLPLYLVPDGAQ